MFFATSAGKIRAGLEKNLPEWYIRELSYASGPNFFEGLTPGA